MTFEIKVLYTTKLKIMFDIFGGNFLLFSILFTFCFTFFVDKLSDCVASFFLPKEGLANNWCKKMLILYSQSSAKSNSIWLFVVCVILAFIIDILNNLKLPQASIFTSLMFGLFVFMLAPSLRKDFFNLLKKVTPFVVMSIIGGYVLLSSDTPDLKYKWILVLSIAYFVSIIFFSILGGFIWGFTITQLIKFSKIFTKILLKNEDPSKYILKYILKSIISYVCAIGGSMFLICIKSLLVKYVDFFTSEIYQFIISKTSLLLQP